ncbi:MAG TPA: PA14 domain-containing protein, partial [Planctomycetota bacterium]|nr:PA14 domain-containing protein [Planctomycetota bacterium]
WRLRYVATQNIVLATSALTVPEGQSRTFTVRLANAPASDVVVNVARSSGSTDVTATPASLTFTPSTWSTPQTVTVAAAHDGDATNDGATVTCSASGLSSQSVSVTVTDDDTASGAPTASITAPRNGDVVSGTNAEFYGDGRDDAGTVRAEFYVDGVLRYTDVNSTGHYHYGGDHLRWDTTALTNGPHTLMMRVFDAQGQSGSHQISVTVDNAAPQTGLRAEYFNNADLTSPVFTRTDAVVDFDWGSGSPDPAVGADTFSARWTGQVQPEYTQTYAFHATTDDGVRLWVNNVLIIDRWVNQAPTTSTGSIALTAGQRYDLRMEYYENGGGAVAKLEWSSPSRTRQVIPQARLYPVVLPLPWVASDVGSPSLAGSSTHSGGTFTVNAGGADIWGTADAFRFVRQPLGGDLTITARVTSVENTNGWAKAGVMVREGLAPGARNAFMAVTPGNGTVFQRRTAVGGTTASTAGPSLLAPAWVRLVRSGNTFSAYASADGSSWTLVGSQSIAMAVDAYVGLAVTSHDDTQLCTAAFANVALTGTAYRQDAGADGLVVMEAERFHGKLDQGGHTWSVSTSPAGYAGASALLASPNSGANVDTGYVTGAPRLDFRVNFVKAGVHHVWIRGAGATGSDDSVHVGLDGAASATSDRLSSFLTGWTWSRATMDGPSATIDVPTAGLHTVNVWMREDGFVLDRVLLSTSPVYSPAGLGPAESSR